jgi:hypothetical protein
MTNEIVSSPKWGGWTLNLLDADVLLVYEPVLYEVDLGRCKTSAQVLDWICQVASTSWATPEIVGNLVMAINDLLVPQATLCSCGTEQGPKKFSDIRQTVLNGLEMIRCGLR